MKQRLKVGLTLLSMGLFATACDSSVGLVDSNSLTKRAASTELVSDTSNLSALDFSGVTVNITGLKYPIGNAFESHAAAFEEATGATLVFETVPFGDLYEVIETDYKSDQNSYDLLIYPPIWLSDMVKANYLADIKPRVDADAALEWEDITPFFQEHGGTYGDKIYGVPVDGDYYMLYYRSDLLEEANMEPPSTWEDYLQVAETFHGQDLNGDNIPDYVSCLTKQPNHGSWWAFWSIAGSFLQSEGTSQGAFFDVDTMRPLTDNAAFARALEVYKQTGEYGPPGELDHDMSDARDLFIGGRCALTLDHGNTGTLTIVPESKVVDKVATAPLPGSRDVLDRQTGELVACDKFVCPFAVNGVNHAPYAALIGWSAGVNSSSSAKEQAAAYAFISYVSRPAQSNVDVTIGETGFNPYRVSQLSDTQSWVEAGMSATAANKYLGGIGASLNNPNIMLDLTIPNEHSYQQEIVDTTLAAFLLEEINTAEAMERITTGWEALTDELGREEQKTFYRTSLGLTP